MIGAREIERRMNQLERRLGEADPLTEEIVREAYAQAWKRLGATVGPALERFERTQQLDPEIENALDVLWDALHEEAKRIASARGVPWDRVLRQLTI